MSKQQEDPKVKELEERAKRAQMDAAMVGFELGGHVATCQKLLSAIGSSAGKEPDRFSHNKPPAPSAEALAEQNELAARHLTELVGKSARLSKAAKSATERWENAKDRTYSHSTYGATLPGVDQPDCGDCTPERRASCDDTDVQPGSKDCRDNRKSEAADQKREEAEGNMLTGTCPRDCRFFSTAPNGDSGCARNLAHGTLACKALRLETADPPTAPEAKGKKARK